MFDCTPTAHSNPYHSFIHLNALQPHTHTFTTLTNQSYDSMYYAIDCLLLQVCSVTLSNLHVYVCLVCGKYFQGRGKATPAYTHSVQCGHFVFMNLHDGRAFCLPDGYEVVIYLNPSSSHIINSNFNLSHTTIVTLSCETKLQPHINPNSTLNSN